MKEDKTQFNKRNKLGTPSMCDKKDGPKYPCDHCVFVSMTLSALKTHKKRNHKIFCCAECVFEGTQSELLYHKMYRHKGFKYPCDQCEFAAKALSDLNLHKVGRHSDKKEITPEIIDDTKQFVKKNHKCDFCEKSFTTKGAFTIHTRTHIREKPQHCEFCPREFHTKGALQTHERKHTGEKPYKCDMCDEKYAQTGQLKNHMIIHVEKKTKSGILSKSEGKDNPPKYPCDRCEFVSMTLSTLKTHKKRNHKIFCCAECEFEGTRSELLYHQMYRHKGFEYPCDQCEFAAQALNDLNMHKIGRHSDQKEITQEMRAAKRKREEIEEIYSCEKCEYKGSESELNYHAKYRHKGAKYPCDQCEYAGTKLIYLRSHKNVHHKNHDIVEYHYCKQCKYKGTEAELDYHNKYRHKGLEYPCDQCEYAGNKRMHLKKHTLRKHIKEGLYRCFQCEFATDYLQHFKEHQSVYHTEDVGKKTVHVKYFPCNLCDYEGSQVDLIYHEKYRHKGVKYPCDQCEYATNIIADLKYHQIRYHTINDSHGEKSCERCEYRGSQTELFYHIKYRHKRKNLFQCDRCEYSARKHSLLKKHMDNKHKENESCTSCKQCEYTGSQKEVLYHEKHRHRGAEYPCDQCEYATNFKTSLKRHQLVIHRSMTGVKRGKEEPELGIYILGLKVMNQPEAMTGKLTIWQLVRNFVKKYKVQTNGFGVV